MRGLWPLGAYKAPGGERAVGLGSVVQSTAVAFVIGTGTGFATVGITGPGGSNCWGCARVSSGRRHRLPKDASEAPLARLGCVRHTDSRSALRHIGSRFNLVAGRGVLLAASKQRREVYREFESSQAGKTLSCSNYQTTQTRLIRLAEALA